MERRTLGNAGRMVSLTGLGTGGANALGQRRGAAIEDVRRFVRRAIDLGIDLFDTAPAYGSSEERLGDALAGVPRTAYTIASKYTYRTPDGSLVEAEAVERSLHESLRRLRVTELDTFQVHALKPADYDAVVDRHLPVLVRAREAGLIRSIGVTESFAGDDPLHATLIRAVDDGWPEVLMVGYNVLHQNAERHVLPVAATKRIGVLVMAAVRNALASRTALETAIAGLKRDGDLAADSVPDEHPLGWLIHGDTESVQAACYRFAAGHPAVSSVLTGTFDLEHLAEDVAAIDHGPLPGADVDRLRRTFGHLELGLGR